MYDYVSIMVEMISMICSYFNGTLEKHKIALSGLSLEVVFGNQLYRSATEVVVLRMTFITFFFH